MKQWKNTFFNTISNRICSICVSLFFWISGPALKAASVAGVVALFKMVVLVVAPAAVVVVVAVALY